MKTSKSGSIQLPEVQLQILLGLLRLRLPGHAVYAFGSRANGNVHATSDLDLLIRGDGPVGLGVLAELKADLEEAEIDPRVDLVDWWRIDEEFREAIWPEAVLVMGAPH
jgi:predicted nucleotidyltransferase